MYIRLPDYDVFRGFDFPNETYSAWISKRVCEVFAQPSLSTIKHRLFRSRIPKKLFKSLRELCIRDNTDEYKRGRLFQRVAKIHIARTPKVLAVIDFVDAGE